jgi:hypothetical protein
MFKWLERRRYRDAAWKAAEMLSMVPRRLMLKQYPNANNVTDGCFTQHLNPEATAIRIVSAILSDQTEQLFSDERRRLVFEQLRHVNDVAGTPKEDDYTRLICWIELTATNWVKQNRITQQERDFLMSEIMGSLAGKSSEERHRNRLIKIIDDHLMPDSLRKV